MQTYPKQTKLMLIVNKKLTKANKVNPTIFIQMDKTTANHKLDQAKLNQTTVNKPAVPFHPSLKREVWLQKHPFASFCTVINDIKISSYFKNQPTLLS